MRIVQFPLTDPIVYPEEGITAFGETFVEGGFVVGEYYGAQTDPTLPDYPGVWPIPAPPVYTTSTEGYRVFDPNIGFTGAEQAAISASVDEDVQAGYLSLKMRPIIDLEDPEVVAILDSFVADGDLSQPREDELTTQGVLA